MSIICLPMHIMTYIVIMWYVWTVWFAGKLISFMMSVRQDTTSSPN